MFALKASSAWVMILVLAVLNGILREAVLLPLVGRPAAYVLSGLLLSLLILAVAMLVARWLMLTTLSRCLIVGLLWLCLTLVFEFGFGGLVQKRSWADMLEAYTFKGGNIWPVVLIATFCAPLLAARARRLLQNAPVAGPQVHRRRPPRNPPR